MWIKSMYYPESHGETGSDEGYAWTPDIGFGWYLLKYWTLKHLSTGGWAWKLDTSVAPVLIKAYSGGPILPDPNEPTIPVIIPVPALSYSGIYIHINGVATEPVLHYLNTETKIKGMPVPLIIGVK